jgi:hypothetical protein
MERDRQRAVPEERVVERLQAEGVAESALLVPVGAALEVRDRVVGAIQPWTKRTTAERELNRVRRDVRRYERRGTVARNRVLRQLKTRRNRVVRLLNRRRTQVTRLVRGQQRSIRQNGHRVQRNVKPQVNRVQKSLQDQTREARELVQQFV